MRFLQTLRDRLTLRRVLTAAVVFAITVLAFGSELDVAVGVGVAIVWTELLRTMRETPGVDARHVKLSVGVLAVIGSGVLVALGTVESTSAVALTAGTTVAGCWLILDAVADIRRGTVPQRHDDGSSLKIGFQSYVAKLIVDELEQGPKNVTELAEACDLTESRVRDGIELLEDSGVVVSRGAGYELDGSHVGGRAFLRLNLSRLGRRLFRPIR